MAWANQKQKSFQQKYRVFSAAFWQNNGSTFDLEKSDKIVLPPSALNALTDCNASFPVLLKIQIMDSLNNKPKASNIFSYVIDYSAPEGLIYMSSWMITKLELDQSGQSVVELSLPTENNLKYQCPTAEFLQLQPHSISLMLLDNVTTLVNKSLCDYYSSLRVKDTLTLYHNDKEYKLNIVKISGKETSYTPKCVRLNNSISNNNLMLGFSEPLKSDMSEAVNDDEKKGGDDNKDSKEDEESMDSSFEWEIVSVEKVKSISDLSFEKAEPIKNDDNKQEIKQEQKAEPVAVPSHETDANQWKCEKCATVNELSYKFCPKCGCKQPPKVEKAILKVSEDAILLKKMSIINDGTYSCGEERQTGWIVKNVSNKAINVKGKLVKFAGSNDVSIKFDELLTFDMAVNDEMFILIEIKAPLVPNQYHVFCQLLNATNGKRICEVLSIPVIVKSSFGDAKEQQIRKVLEMGFSDRKKIITALKKWNWDELKAINWLATH